MNVKKLLVGALSIALVAGTVTSCKKKKANKRVIGAWVASEYSETTSGSTVDKWKYHNNTSIYTNTDNWEETVTLSTSSYKLTEVNQDSSGTATVISTVNDEHTQTFKLTLNEDGTAEYEQTFTKKSRTQVTSPVETCGTGQTPTLWGEHWLSCDGTYTFVSDGTVTAKSSGVWFWGNDTEDRSSIVIELDRGDSQVWIVEELTKDGSLKLSRTESNSSSQPSGDGAGTDEDSETTTYSVTLGK